MQHDDLGPLYCSECNYEAPGDHSWRSHVANEHDGEDPRIEKWTCLSPWCSREFRSTDEMAQHIAESHTPRVLLPADFDLDVLAQEAQAQLAFADWCRRNGRDG